MWDGTYKYTFWDDFTEVESNKNSITILYEQLFRKWCNNYERLTELVMVINHKAWYWHRQGNEEMSEFYSELYYRADNAAIDYLDKHNRAGLRYYYQILD